MLLRGLWLLCCTACVGVVTAQESTYYYPYATESEERPPLVLTDSALFYRAVQSVEDVYAAATEYNLSFITAKRRGQEYALRTVALNGLTLPSHYLHVLRALRLGESCYAGVRMTPKQIGATAGVREFRFDEALPLRYAAVNLTDRNYRAGVRLSATEDFAHGWNITAALQGRTGRDLHVQGLFTHALTAGLRAMKHFDSKHTLSLLLAVPLSMQGLRSSATEETLRLTGDHLYNPAWGFQQGKERNSHVRRELLPLAVVAYALPLSAISSLEMSTSAEWGVEKYSALGWYDARTPMPDNYRYLPSYADDPTLAQVWRDNDTRYTQIDWDELWQQNRMAAGEAVYALEDRVERVCRLQVNALFTTQINNRLLFSYGLRAGYDNRRYYKQMRDLLGAEYLTDIDQFLIDDDAYHNKLQNDLRHPNRRILQGDRFGYDYTLRSYEVAAVLVAQYRSDRLYLDLGAEIGDRNICRWGHYEKELFPGTASYGRSRRLHFTSYTLKAALGWSFSPRMHLGANFMAGALPPAAEDLFLQPHYNNRIIEEPKLRKLYAAEVNFSYVGRTVLFQAATYITSSGDGMQTRRYYDDLASTFCDMAITGIGQLSYGLELSADIRIAYHWTILLAASVGRYKYAKDPQLTIFSDVDNTVVMSPSRSYMGSCQIGSAPQVTALSEVTYWLRGWGVRAAVVYAGGRYVEPALLRRTERVLRTAGDRRESFDALTEQERMGDAFALDASAFRTFRLRDARLTLSLMVKNLLNDQATARSGYESMRLRRTRSGDATSYLPQATRYTSIYPRSFYLSLSYKF